MRAQPLLLLNPRPIIKLLWLAALLLAAVGQAAAREQLPPPSSVRPVQPLAGVPQLALPPTDVEAELAQDTAKGVATPLRFAVPHPVEAAPDTHGAWEALPDGWLWRLRVRSPGATDLNLGFTTFWLPEGATLHLSSETEKYHQGPYTAADNHEHGQLWTPVVPGEAAVVELFVPHHAVESPRLRLTQVGAGYRDFFERTDGGLTPKIGACNVDVICPQGDPWRNEIRSVGVYTINGIWTCTGTLVGNTAQNFRSFFLTAHHCGLTVGNAPSVVVYWNFESPVCGALSGGSLAQNQSGATFRASRSDVDFALIELSATPSPLFNVHYAGWDRSGDAPQGCVGIHQPGCDEKCISFSTSPLTTINSCIGSGVNTHWYVRWSLGVTEPGSSGSGIWDSNTRRLVGFLSGGASRCGGSDLTDCYGKFSVAWNGASPATRLSDWLDPIGSGVSEIPGTDPYPRPVITAAGATLVGESCTPTNSEVDPGETVTVNFSLRNLGTLATANLVATLEAAGGVTAPDGSQSFGALAPGGAAVSRPFTFTASGSCGGVLSARLALRDGDDDLGTITFNLVMGVPDVTTILAQDFDGVPAPSLPAGWISSPAGGWTTTTAQRDTPPNSAFTTDPSNVTDKHLISAAFAVDAVVAQLNFRHWYAVETGYDGGVLEISVNGGAFTDIISAGGAFVSGGYSGTLSTAYANPIGGRPAWTGNSGGFITTAVNLPPGAPGRLVRLRWRLGTDSSVSGTGWYVDSITLDRTTFECCVPLVRPTIVGAWRMGSDFVLGHTTVAGQTYELEGRPGFPGAGWKPRGSVMGDGSVKYHTNDVHRAGHEFFRVRTQ